MNYEFQKYCFYDQRESKNNICRNVLKKNVTFAIIKIFIMKLLQLIKKYRWGIAFIVFLGYFLFGEGGVFQHRKLDKEIRQLKAELEMQKNLILQLQEQNNELIQNSQSNQENFLRTHLYLKKDDEDVFRISNQIDE